jgi:hypothetical protein
MTFRRSAISGLISTSGESIVGKFDACRKNERSATMNSLKKITSESTLFESIINKIDACAL